MRQPNLYMLLINLPRSTCLRITAADPDLEIKRVVGRGGGGGHLFRPLRLQFGLEISGAGPGPPGPSPGSATGLGRLGYSDGGEKVA